MIPISLQISGFLSYLQPVHLDFTAFDLACISGSNGAGKSSLLDAITWALFGQARRKDDAIINTFATSAEVVFDFSYEDNQYRIQRIKPREKTGMLDFFVKDGSDSWKTLSEHTMRETEQRIQQTLRLDYETFINASFFLQGKADQFAQQRPGDRKRILSSILGLEMWDTYRERSAEYRKSLENDQVGLQSRLDEINAELAEEGQRKERLQLLQQNLEVLSTQRREKESLLENIRRLASSLEEQKRLVEMLSGQRQSVRRRLEQQRTDLETRRAEQKNYQQQIAAAPQIEASYQRWQELRNELQRWEEIAAKFHQCESRRAAPLLAIESERSRLTQEQRTLMEQQRQAAELEKILPTLENQFNSLHTQLTENAQQLAQKPELEAEQKTLHQTQSELKAENKRLREEMDRVLEHIRQVKEMVGVSCPFCGQELSPDDRQKLAVDLEKQGKEMGDRFRSNLEQIRLGDLRLTEVQDTLSQLERLDVQQRAQQRQADQLEDRLKQMRTTLEVWQTTAAPHLAAVSAALSSEAFAVAARDELARVDAELKKLGYDSAAHEKIRLAEQEARASEVALRQLENTRAALVPLEREITGLEKQILDGDAEAEKLEQSYRQAEQKYQSDFANLPDLLSAEKEFNDLQNQENRLRLEVGGALQKVEVLKNLRQRQQDFLRQKEELARSIGQVKMLERAFSKDGIPALLIEQALPEIEIQTNDILDRLSAGAMSVQFSTQRQYKDKSREDRQETLDIFIRDAAGAREYELFSGGEAFRVNFAIRLALSRVLAQRAGARLQTLVIDEGFGSQDADGRQRLVEALNLVRGDFKKVLIITHLEEMKDQFPARIEVEKFPEGSRVRVVA